jgi:hypothetical protein
MIVLTRSGFCWAALANSSRQGSYRGMDKRVKNMVLSVKPGRIRSMWSRSVAVASSGRSFDSVDGG